MALLFKSAIAHAAQNVAVRAMLLPLGAMLIYPSLLSAAHAAFVGGDLAIGSAWLLLAFLAPLSGLGVAYFLRQSDEGSNEGLARIASWAVVVPPAYTLVGVVLYLAKITISDQVVWLGLCAAATCLAVLLAYVRRDDRAGMTAPKRHMRLRTAHGIVALALLCLFLGPHLFNHSLGILGEGLHREVMLVLRSAYRHDLVEPVIVAGFLFQVLTGLVLLRTAGRPGRGLLDSLQRASGLYLTVYILTHMNSVFTLARHFGIETDYAWATSVPRGLLMDGWDIRLVPHYSLAVLALLVHLACGLRIVLRAHGMAEARLARVTWGLIAGAITVATLISAGMLGLRI